MTRPGRLKSIRPNTPRFRESMVNLSAPFDPKIIYGDAPNPAKL